MTSHSSATLILAGLLLVYSCCSPVQGTHFRGAIIQWSPADPVSFNGTIIITHRIAWRRGRAFCDASTITSGNLIGQAGNLECRTGCFGTVGSMQFQCTDFSEDEDWSSGQLSYAYDISGVDYFEASYTGGDWIALEIGGGTWEVRVKGSFTVRSDTGRINTSPITAISPVLRLQHGCNHSIDIPTDDIDGDEVRCRWARRSDRECGGVCEAFIGAILDERNCQIQYEAVDSTGWYAVALQMEDFISPDAITPLSSVPIQFLVLVFSSDEPCSQKPEFVGVTRVGGSCIGVPINSTFHEPLIAMRGGPNVSIVAINTVSPQGLRKSSLATGPGEGQWHVNITWTPVESQLGPSIFCYAATDSLGLTSDQLCVTFLGGVEAPNYVSESNFPTDQILPNHTQWSIQFDKQFLRPTRTRFFRIIREDGREVVKIDVAISPSVLYPEGSLGREIQFTTSYLFAERMQYYVSMDPGVAVGPNFCGPESPALRDPNVWVVSVADVTPPDLVFLTKAEFSNENFTINWNVSEEVTATCTLQSPTLQYTEICNDKSFSATQLQEGLHFLFVQATDLAGNAGTPMRYGWTADLTPPTVTLTFFPNQLSNATEWTFMYECADEPGCSFSCSINEMGQLPQHSPCGTTYDVDGLINGREYEFEVVATDGVGNAGHIVYWWKIDTTPPALSSIGDVTVECGQDLSPNANGIPQVTDNEDPQPIVEYEDMPSDGCSFQRLWRATDKAGNTASQLQLVTLTSPMPPQVIATRVMILPCGSVEDVILLVQDLREFLVVQHPCDRPVEITFTDSANVDRCGFSFSRTWLVEDDCGGSSTFQQTISILDQQFPDAPENGQLNTDINQPLRWPQRSGSFSYEVYIWQFGNSRPTLPTVVTTMRQYQPASHYPPATKMLWQVEYRTDVNVTIPSPVWGFETEAFSDFVITDIALPPFSFSGQDFEVSWTVINVGNLSSGSGVWYDRVWLGPTQDISESRIVATVQQRRILEPTDGYISQTGAELRNTDIGLFYLFVETDIYQRVNDIDHINNRRTSTSPLEVRLTPPPNLEIMDIILPQSTFSGELISICWTVENTGSGVTATDQWFDRVYWSSDQQIDADDLILDDFQILDILPPGATYMQCETVTVPKAIFGEFFIIVGSDIRNQVYEHDNEEDNARVSDNPIQVTLSPPPDLIVSLVSVEEEYITGSQMVINYTVTNNGAGAPFESFWTDQVVLIDELLGSEILLDRSIHYGTVQPGESYSKQVQYFISPNLAPGIYNLTVHTDTRGQVFEFLSNANNMLSTSVSILLRLSDLTVSKVEASLSSSSEGSTVELNFTVINTGSGRSINSLWVDRVGVSDSPSVNDNIDFVASHIQRNELLPNQTYSVKLSVNLASDTFGELYIHVITDYYNRVMEEDDQNNRNLTGPISVPLILPDLVIDNMQVNSNNILSGDEIQLCWTVANLGNATLPMARWTDSIYLTMFSVLSNQVPRLEDYTISTTLKPTESYKYNATVRIPNGLFGRYYLFVQIDNFQQVDEVDNTGNNVYSVPLFLEVPSSPDLQVRDITVNFNEGIDRNQRVLTIQWSVVNVGSDMMGEMTWIDQLFVSSNPVFDRQNIVRVADMEVVGNLGTNQEYFMTKAVILPNDAFGSLFVYAEVDSANDITEISAEDNNIGRSSNQVSVPELALPQITVQINTHIIPSTNFAGETLPFQYDVSNLGTGNLPLSSWTDGVYLVMEENADRSSILGNGILIDTILHNRPLEAGEQFQIFRNISIPYLPNQQLYFAVVLDINGNLGDPADIGIGGDILSQTSVPLLIEQGPLPDLVALLPIDILTTQGGQPMNVTLRVANIGNNTARGLWYGALYLSQDALLDPFDIRLITVLEPSSLDISTTHDQTVEIFVPLDLPSANYYFFYEVDVGNSIPEQGETDNNIDRQVITILQSISTDIAVVNVSITPLNSSYETDFTATWTLRNNGSVIAEGYKCDTLYLSEDDVWDVMDHQQGEPNCGRIAIHPHNGNDDNDLSFQLVEVTPYIAQQAYNGIVVSRSNIRDLNIANNIGNTQNTLNIQALSIILNAPTTITLQQGINKVYRIDSVPAEETLVATLKATAPYTYHDLFLRHEKPPTDFEYDAFSRRPLSVDQFCVVRNTRDGSYYLRIESSASNLQGNYSVVVVVKIAKFEILDISPHRAAPLGNITLQLSGTVIGYAVEAYIYNDANPSELHSASRVYWFSSEEVYATFNITDFPLGNYTVRLTDRLTAAAAELSNSFEVARGIPGQATLQVMPPRPLRSGETGQLSVLIQNTGNTDILSPLISVSSPGDVLINLLHDSVQSETVNGSAATSFQSVAFNGPAGILLPGGYSLMYFEVRQRTPLVANEELLVAIIVSSLTLPHAYLDEKYNLRPVYVPQNVWDSIWDNALLAVGTTWASFQEYTSEVATHMSLVHKRNPLSSEEFMEYALKVADGLYTARVLLYVEDISSDVGDMPLPLVVHRYYSSYISKRRTSGPCGKGWLLAWWELRIIKDTLSEVVIQKDREHFVFTAQGNGLYVNDDSQITVTREEMVYEDPNAIEVYIFNRVTGQLARIENLVDDSLITIQYNGRQQPVTFSHSNGDTMTITYTDRGLLNFADITDQEGNVKQSSSYAYDSSGVHLMTVTVNDQSATYSYNEEGDLIEVVEATQEAKSFSYDDRGLLVESAAFSDSEKLLSSVSITYNWNGLLTLILQPENRTLVTYIDSQGQPLSLASLTDSQPILQIDLPQSNGRLLLAGDQVLSETRMDVLTNTLHLKDGNGNEIVYELGESGEIVSLTDSGGQTYGVRYTDATGVSELSNPDGSKLEVQYGIDGHVSGLTNPDSSEILFSYDSEDNLISKVADGVESRYEYNGERRLVRGTNDKGSVEIEYSREGVPLKIVYPNGRKLSYGYNAKFQRVYIADDSGYNVSYNYNDRDQVSEIRREDNADWVVRFNYTARGELTRKTYANGAYTDYSYDSQGRLLTLRNFNHRETLLSFFIYEYDLNGQILAVHTLSGTWSFQYDAVDQLMAWEAPTGEVTRIRYDSRGNRMSNTQQGETRSYSINSINQYLSYADSESFTYDMNGNLKQKVVNGRTESFTFDSEGRLTQLEDPDNRCSYEYDALGNLYRKLCSDGSDYSYLMDPFGPYGADVIAEISGETVTYFVHSLEHGLLAAFKKDTDWYYQFNGDESVVSILNKEGAVVNSYLYDPFGQVIESSESVRNIFQYVGQLGVIKDEAVENVFMMRARHYDATLGRFISFDPLGLTANTPNLYIYAGNNPLLVKDPTGEIGLAGSLEGIATYALTTPPSMYSAGGLLGSAVSGAFRIPVVGAALGSITEDLIDRGSVDWSDVAKDATVGAAFGTVRKKVVRLFARSAGKLVKRFGKKAKWLIGPLRNTWNKLKSKGPEFLRNTDLPQFIGGIVTSKVQGRIRKFVEGLPESLKKYWKGFVQWIVSIDPNDIIGPSGFGDAHFIHASLVLDYKIRFENDANATAPAQRVFISHQLDDDLDERTFRVGSFGFGDFTQNITVQRSFIQDVVNVTESLGVLVRVRAGIDVVNNEATWDLQAIDPETGEAPVDPSVGFLPPNNGTNGQGFVTFTVRAKQQLGPLPTIDAQASIIFDRNEPIDTPPIFNTIDNVVPTVNMTTIQDLLITGTPAIRVSKSDVGSGVATVDLYLLEDGQVRPLLQVTTEETPILPLSQGYMYQVVAMAVDNVGNMQALDDALRNVLLINVTMVRITCLNGCSGRGSCSAIGICQCDSGFSGSDCSQEGICPQINERIGILNYTFNWPDTDTRDIVAIQCPCRDLHELTEDLFAIKECGVDGSWLQTEFSTCLSGSIMMLCEGGIADPTDTLLDILELPGAPTSGDVAILFSAASTLLTNEIINNDTVREILLDVFDDLLSTDGDILLAISETTRIGERLLSSFDKIGGALQLLPGTPIMVNRTLFTLIFVELDSDDLPDEGYFVNFGGVDGEQVNLPKSLFGSFAGNSSFHISSSQISTSALFRGRDESITIASNILTIKVLEEEEPIAMTEPITLKFRNLETTPDGFERSCRWLNMSTNGMADIWSSKGCSVLEETQMELICSCNRLSSFAVILTAVDATPTPSVTTPPTTPTATTHGVHFVLPIIPTAFLAAVVGLILITLIAVMVMAIIIMCKRGISDYLVGTGYSKDSHMPFEVVSNAAAHEAEKPLEKETSFVA